MEKDSGTPRLSDVVPCFLRYVEVDLGFASQSIIKYRDCLTQIVRMIGDPVIAAVSKEDVLDLKSAMFAKGNGTSRQVSILSTFKRLLQYCQSELHVETIDPQSIIIPKRPRREVVYLTAEEVDRFVNAIPMITQRGKLCVTGLRFRALVEVLLGSAMRIGEVLSLTRVQIDFQSREARIIGKGAKQRTVFFTARALVWIERYLATRKDDCPALFVCQDGKTPLQRADIWRFFARTRRLAGINKPVRPHLLRHTAATQLLFNGCPVGHIKEILGHERLETTCRYYLGLDHRAAKEAHQRFLTYGTIDQSLAA